MSDSLWPYVLHPASLPCPWDSPSKNTGVGCWTLLQGMFLNLLNLPLLHLLHWQAGSLSLALPGRPNTTYISSVAQSCPTLCNPMASSKPGFPVHRQLPEFAQTLVQWVGDAIQPSYLLSSPSPAFNLSEHKFPMSRLFTSGGQSIGASGSALPMNTECWFPLGLTGLIFLLSKGLSRRSSPALAPNLDSTKQLLNAWNSLRVFPEHLKTNNTWGFCLSIKISDLYLLRAMLQLTLCTQTKDLKDSNTIAVYLWISF